MLLKSPSQVQGSHCVGLWTYKEEKFDPISEAHSITSLCTDSSIQNFSFSYQAKNFKDLMHCNRFCYLLFAFVFCYESFLKCVVLRQLFSPSNILPPPLYWKTLWEN